MSDQDLTSAVRARDSHCFFEPWIIDCGMPNFRCAWTVCTDLYFIESEKQIRKRTGKQTNPGIESAGLAWSKVLRWYPEDSWSSILWIIYITYWTCAFSSGYPCSDWSTRSTPGVKALMGEDWTKISAVYESIQGVVTGSVSQLMTAPVVREGTDLAWLGNQNLFNLGWKIFGLYQALNSLRNHTRSVQDMRMPQQPPLPGIVQCSQ